MKKMKYMVAGLIVIVVLLILDLFCIYVMGSPILAVKTEDNGVSRVYKGLIYNIYDCSEYSIPQIKVKGTKFTCSTLVGK